MNRLTSLIIIAYIILPHYSISQQYTPASFFWNQYMHTNPAMAGAIYKHQANAQVKWKFGWSEDYRTPTDLWGSYAIRLDSINSGIGVSYAGNLINGGAQHVALVSYAYHIPIKKMFLSIGISAGTNTLDNHSKSRTLFQGDFGVAIHGENWNFGLSSTRLTGYLSRIYKTHYDMVPLYWMFGEYKSHIGKNGSLAVRSQIGASLINAEDLYGVFALIAGGKSFWLGPSISTYYGSEEYQVGWMLGFDIRNRLRIGYTFEIGLSAGDIKPEITGPRAHEVILSYQLK